MAKDLFSARSFGSVVHVALAFLLVPVHVVPVLLAGIGLATVPVFLLGVPLLAAALLAARGTSWLERRRVERLLGVPLPLPGVPAGMLALVRDSSAWRVLGHGAVLALWGATTALLFVALLGAGFGLVFLPLAAAFLPPVRLDTLGVGVLAVDQPLIYAGAVLGLGLLLTALAVAPWLADATVAITAWFCGGGRMLQLRRRIEVLEHTRSAMVDAAEAERLKIERDLHDGAQQRLLAVALAVSRARRNLDRDRDKTVDLLAEAHDEARAAIDELREIARSTHPPVLSQRGLAAAVESTAARHPIPVTARVDLGDRPSRRAEAAAYYVICEALANTAKHAQAQRSEVEVWREGELLRLRITDDGRGGAVLEPGGGLAGLVGRLHALDGTLTVHSPDGGPTVLAAELPWTA